MNSFIVLSIVVSHNFNREQVLSHRLAFSNCLHVCLIKNNVWYLEANGADPGGQPGTFKDLHLGIPSFMSRYRFFRVRISIFTSKISSGIWSRFEADPGGWQWLGTGKEAARGRWRLILEASQLSGIEKDKEGM
jgi:hypothetical protein